jgi:hypothetical protein
LTEVGSLQVNTDKGTRHWWIAGQEQRFPLFQLTSKTITDRVGAQVRSIISYSYHHCCWKVPACEAFHTIADLRYVLLILYLKYLYKDNSDMKINVSN